MDFKLPEHTRIKTTATPWASGHYVEIEVILTNLESHVFQVCWVENPNGSTTFRIPQVFDFWTTDKAEIELMIAHFALHGNWEQENRK